MILLTINNFIKKIIAFIRNRLKIIIYLLSLLLIIFILVQFYLYKQEEKVLKLSILYQDALNNLDNNNLDQEMELISNEKGIYGILASLEMINYNLQNKNYQYALTKYLELLEDSQITDTYKDIIAIKASYNLIDYLKYDEIKNLLNFVNESNISLNAYKQELLFLLAVKNQKISQVEEIYNSIISNDEISSTIKNRVKKIYEFEIYK